jgi:hypothetical protein
MALAIRVVSGLWGVVMLGAWLGDGLGCGKAERAERAERAEPGILGAAKGASL